MRKVFKVEVKGVKGFYTFDTKQQAEDYAITATAWSNGQYRITPIFVKS